MGRASQIARNMAESYRKQGETKAAFACEWLANIIEREESKDGKDETVQPDDGRSDQG